MTVKVQREGDRWVVLVTEQGRTVAYKHSTRVAAEGHAADIEAMNTEKDA